MTYLEFRSSLLAFQVFSTKDVEKRFPGFDTRRLVEWQKKGYIRKLVNKWYLFSECVIDEPLLFRISNCIYKPSYISLESALAYYHLIPEAVYIQKAITTRKTIQYVTPLGTYDYHNLKPKLFFGYTILHKDTLPIMMADMEKAILDYLYLNSSLKSANDIEQLRLNSIEIQDNIDWEKLDRYKSVFESKTLDARIKNLKKQLENAHTA
jgi:predicted transcriptional regulator of viral defense system